MTRAELFGCNHHKMVVGRDDPLGAAKAEHHGHLKQKVRHRLLPVDGSNNSHWPVSST
jgi:hypothetical protein